MKTLTGTWLEAASGTLSLILEQAAFIGGGSHAAPRIYRTTLDPAGAIPADFRIWGNDEIMPEGSRYQITLQDNLGVILRGPQMISICGPREIDITDLLKETPVIIPPEPPEPPTPPTPDGIDLLDWVGIANADVQHLVGDPTSPYVAFAIDTDPSWPPGFPANTFVYLKNIAGNPWDFCTYDANYALKHWITENGDADMQSGCPGNNCWGYANAYKRFVTPLPILPRYLTPGTPVTIDTPGPNDLVRTTDCETTSNIAHLGDVRSITSGPTDMDWGGSIGTAPTIKNQYLLSGQLSLLNWGDREDTYYIQGYGRVAWYEFKSPAHDGNWTQTNSNVNTTLASGGAPVPNFPCGAGKSWW
jgi:hypothetical protein